MKDKEVLDIKAAGATYVDAGATYVDAGATYFKAKDELENYIKHKSLEASLEVRKQERLDKYIGLGLSFLGGSIGVFCIIYATHVALG
jgi:hypothetical protein